MNEWQEFLLGLGVCVVLAGCSPFALWLCILGERAEERRAELAREAGRSLSSGERRPSAADRRTVSKGGSARVKVESPRRAHGDSQTHSSVGAERLPPFAPAPAEELRWPA